MKNPSAFNLLFNGLGVLIGLVVVGYIIYAAFQTEQLEPCSARYPAPMRFALHGANGAPLTPIELQARAGLHEWGVIENATVVADAEVPGGAALQVKLAPLPARGDKDGRVANGIDFRWQVPGAGTATAACLSYSIWLPQKFDFSFGGALPGIFSARPDTSGEFGTRPQWRLGGNGELTLAQQGSPFKPANQPAFPLQLGSWTRIEQELVLNKPGEANGTARLWVDGKLRAETVGVAFRGDDSGFTGVLVDVGYFRSPPPDSELRLSVLDLAWREQH